MIRTRALRYRYPAGTALAFPDLDVPQGATLLLHGPSGSGKSTWLALAAGLLTAGDGDIVIGGQSLAALSRAGRDGWRARHLGFLPQKLHLSDALSVERNLALAFYAAGVAHDAASARRALEQLGVADLASRRPSQLSGGQAQRVALARAILMSPQVILADEPTASLDDEAALSALRLLAQSASRSRATLVIATHDRRVRQALPAALALQLDRP
ncbi:MAG: ATP-binding cassette domain-containing protein [Ramlibacter sp.]|nr:ATP-binding cassette domain-containing protein [Ramlibacter sp.]